MESGDVTSLKPELTFIIDDKQSALAALPPNLLQFCSALTGARSSSDQAPIPSSILQNALSHSTSSYLPVQPSICPPSRKGQFLDLEIPARPSTSKTFTIPLESDSQFFRVLGGNLQALNLLREKEELDLKGDINALGQAVIRLTTNNDRTNMQIWGEIFRVYLDCNIFFSTLERESHRNSAATAQERLKDFSKKLNHTDLVTKAKGNSARVTLGRFSKVNLTLLRHLQYQELNKAAMRKILKSKERFRSN